MELELDLKRIEELGRARDGENWDYRTFLKGHDMSDAELDALVHDIYAEVSAKIDCTQCGNCCKQIGPVLDEADISTFARGLQQPVSGFKETYITLHDDSPDEFEFNALPCPFLKDNRCSNYDYRPQTCRSYPHLHKEGFRSRLIGVIDNYSICPIVFNVFEQLKFELGPPGRPRFDDNLDYW